MKRNEMVLIMNEINSISPESKLDYITRLKLPYIKKGTQKNFYDQYDKGSGKELENSFWSPISSSRLAFEVYSWLAKTEDIIDIEFEFKLIGITARGVPNMDVFIERSNEATFIESKFTEKYKQSIECDSLPAAYWKQIGDKEALRTDGKPIGTTLIKRYHNDENALTEFLNFIEFNRSNLAKLDSSNKPDCWMEYSQEIKHLYGIYFYVKKHKELHNKKINFYNVYYYLEDETNTAISSFFIEGEKMMNRLLCKYGVNFNYSFLTAQEIVKKIPNDVIAFGKNASVKDILKGQFLL